MSTIWRKWAGLLALASAFVLGVASVAAQTATPAADAATTAAQTGGWLGLSWWVWIVIGLLLLFLLWWLFFRRRPAPPPPPPPRRITTAEPPARPVMPEPMPYTPVPESPSRLVTPELESFGLAPEPDLSVVSEPDNLKRIEGIGPRIESILNSAGITTFRALSNTPVERLREILNAAELRGSFGDPTSWPEQARLAAEGMWDQLKTMQDRLKGGR